MGSSTETSVYGPAVSPWRRAGDADAAHPRRLVGRLGGGGRGRPRARRHRHRHRRLDPPAGGLHRHRRREADLRPLLALGHRRLRLVARPGRPDGEDGARRRDHAEGDGRPRPEGLRPPPRAPVPDFEAALVGDMRGKRIGIPTEYRVDGMPAEIEALWHQRRRLAARRRRRDRRHLAAAHEVRAARLLRHRPRRGLLEPRPLRRRALRPAREDRRERGHHRALRAHPRRGLRRPRCGGG